MKTAIRNIILVMIIILVIVLCLLIYALFDNIVFVKRGTNIFAKQTEKIVEENTNPIFKISQIVLYSSAYAIDNSKEKILQNLDIYQYTDIAIHIDNRSYITELTEENTINEVFIDNIEIESGYNRGERLLNYKNPMNFGKFREIENYNERIDFEVVHKNSSDNENSYSKPTFFTDCSNPISLGYVNKNVLRGYDGSKTNAGVAFDGTILKNAGIDLKELNCKIRFSLHIKNNLDEEYICNVIIDNNLESEDGGINTGYIIRMQNTAEIKYNFFKLPK